jgi:hypothetical protein
MRQIAFLLTMLAFPAQARGADGIAVFPPAITLDGLDSQQQLVVTETRGATRTDRTMTSNYSSSAPAVARVSPTGIISPLTDGAATITATIDGASTTIAITVKNANTPQAVTFERDIQPILTRAGCNAGACHGKARGQNGFQLSLLAYDHDYDFNAITTEAAKVSLRDLTPIARLVLEPALIAVKADAPFKTLADFTAAAKEKPGQLKQSGGSLTNSSRSTLVPRRSIASSLA